jgi:HlyD family secretion protein
LAVAELDNLQQTTQPKLQTARRTQRVADEDLAYFEKTGRAQREKANLFNIKNAEQRLEGAREELKQLEKMYKADDLTEDTEEIILKRSRFAVESAVYGLDTTKQTTDWSLKTAIPREAETLKAAKRDQDFALALAEETLPRTLSKKRYDLEKLKRDQKKADKRLADLKKDLENFDIRSPIDGVVYYGACEAGKWTTGATVAKKLIPTGKLTPNEVFMTIVKPEKLVLRAVVQEGDLAQLKPGLEGKASPISASDKKLPAKLEDLGSVPLPGGGFEAKLSVRNTADARLMPGMNCKVALGDTRSDALQAPKEAVFTEQGESFVFVSKPDAKPQKRIVKTGPTDGKMIEIVEGLSEGEKVLLQKP